MFYANFSVMPFIYFLFVISSASCYAICESRLRSELSHLAALTTARLHRLVYVALELLHVCLRVLDLFAECLEPVYCD